MSGVVSLNHNKHMRVLKEDREKSQTDYSPLFPCNNTLSPFCDSMIDLVFFCQSTYLWNFSALQLEIFPTPLHLKNISKTKFTQILQQLKSSSDNIKTVHKISVNPM